MPPISQVKEQEHRNYSKQTRFSQPQGQTHRNHVLFSVQAIQFSHFDATWKQTLHLKQTLATTTEVQSFNHT